MFTFLTVTRRTFAGCDARTPTLPWVSAGAGADWLLLKEVVPFVEQLFELGGHLIGSVGVKVTGRAPVRLVPGAPGAFSETTARLWLGRSMIPTPMRASVLKDTRRLAGTPRSR
jgi:hypothetical protein